MSEPTTPNELAPCPFCGNETPYFERTGTPRQSCIVVCGNCGCRHESSDEDARSGQSWNERAQRTEPAGTAKKLNAQAMLIKAQEARLSACNACLDEAREARATLESERQANAILTAEVEALRDAHPQASTAAVPLAAAVHDKRCPAALNLSDPCNCGETS